MLDSGTVSLSCSSARGNQRPLPTPYVTQVAFGDGGAASRLNMAWEKKKFHHREGAFGPESDRVAFQPFAFDLRGAAQPQRPPGLREITPKKEAFTLHTCT